jgi:NAD(P)H-hydrate epimerase
MARAGKAIFDVIVKSTGGDKQKLITVVCGLGNNGGDGYVCARLLKDDGYNVNVYALCGKLSPDCQREKERYVGEYTTKIDGKIVVDCLLGTGINRAVEGDYLAAIRAINASGAFVISADIASGINGDNGLVMGEAVKANYTVAIGEYKLGHFLGDGRDYSDRVTVADIGICTDKNYAQIFEEGDVKNLFPKRKSNTHKGSFGKANIIAGSAEYIGAAALSTEAAMRSGCGYVYLTCCKDVKLALSPVLPQIIYTDSHNLDCEAIAIGMGCGNSREVYDEVCYLLQNYAGKLIIDADGLNSLAEYGIGVLDNKKCSVLITPHVKEFSRLSGLSVKDIQNNFVECAQNFAKEHKITVLLKSASSVITDGETTYINISGNSALAKAGSGDMLSGIICGSAARGLNLLQAATVSAYLLGASAYDCSKELTEYCTTAQDILKQLPHTLKYLT